MLAPSLPTYPPTTSTYGLPWHGSHTNQRQPLTGTKSPNPSQPRARNLPTGAP
jgi:hypothetical protein